MIQHGDSILYVKTTINVEMLLEDQHSGSYF